MELVALSRLACTEGAILDLNHFIACYLILLCFIMPTAATRCPNMAVKDAEEDEALDDVDKENEKPEKQTKLTDIKTRVHKYKKQKVFKSNLH